MTTDILGSNTDEGGEVGGRSAPGSMELTAALEGSDVAAVAGGGDDGSTESEDGEDLGEHCENRRVG